MSKHRQRPITGTEDWEHFCCYCSASMPAEQVSPAGEDEHGLVHYTATCNECGRVERQPLNMLDHPSNNVLETIG